MSTTDAVTTSRLQQRAVELNDKAGMPWSDAEKLALSEQGVDDAQLRELIGNCALHGLETLLASPEDLMEYTRAVLVHGSVLLSATN
jgi:hypothetical protein